MASWKSEPACAGIAFIVLIALAVLMSGCDIPLPAIKLPTKAKRKVPWRDHHFAIRSGNRAEIQVKDRNGPPGLVKLFPELIDGFEFGCLEFQSARRLLKKFPSAWQGTLVDASQITWPNGESWVLWAWDVEKHAKLRTISLFLPFSQEVFSCELEFRRTDAGEFTEEVHYCFTWDPGTKSANKYRAFLEAVMPGYADPSSWGSETRGTTWFRTDRTASVTYVLTPDRPFQDHLLGPSSSP